MSRTVELALKKQRLQLKIAGQRLQIERALTTLQPALQATDKIQSTTRWLRAHPQWLVAAGVALLVARPRSFWRWGRRGFIAWRLGRRLQGKLDQLIPQR